MEYYKLWDTPLDGEAWIFTREIAAEGAFDDYDAFCKRVPLASKEFVLFDRVLCAFEQAAVLMKHGLMHPDLYFDAWASPVGVWRSAEAVIRGMREERGNPHLYSNLEWIAGRAADWNAAHDPAAATQP